MTLLPAAFLLKVAPPPACASGLQNSGLFQVPWDPSLLTAAKETLLGFTPGKTNHGKDYQYQFSNPIEPMKNGHF